MQNKQDPPSQSLLLTIPQVAKSLGISRSMVYSLIGKRKGLPVVRLGRSVRVPATSLQKWIEELEHEQK
jgi:excisionase family DNA binding protein